MKKLLLLFITVLTATFAEAQAVDDVFTDGDYSYIVTSIAPLEATVTGSSVTALDIPEMATDASTTTTYSVTAIAVDAFKDNLTIESLTLPSSVTTIGSGAFTGCTALAMDPLDLTNVTSVGGYAFFQCALITSVIVPDTVTFGDGVLRQTGLTSFTIPSGWTTLPNQMLRDCLSITSINIPSTISSLSTATFRGCSNLTAIQVNSDTPVDVPNGNAIATINAAAILYVPSAAAETAYEADASWLAVFDASRIITGELGTNNVEQALGFSMYPNPTNGVVSIRNKQLNNAAVTVYDLNGRALLSKKLNSTSSEINISNLSNGLYIFRVQTEQGEFAKRIIKQ